jgi:hypothetical protein
MYAVYHGPEGLTRIARRTHRLTAILAAALRKAGVQVGGDFFDTLHITGVHADEIHAKARAAGSTCARSTATRSASAWTKPPPAPTWSRWPPCSVRRPTSTRWMPAPPMRCRPACCASPRS